jgi:hypothetical protein
MEKYPLKQLLEAFYMSNFINDIIKNTNEQIKYKNTVTTGEITVDNGDGTYNVKIANAGSAYPNVETINYDAVFSVGEIVDIIFEHGCKEAPKIIGHSKKIKQEPKKVEVDYSGGTGGGKQTVTVTIYAGPGDGDIVNYNANYNTCHSSTVGYYIDTDDTINIGYVYNNVPDLGGDVHGINRGFLYFDTSIIPIEANITTAIIYIVNSGGWPDTAFDLVIQNGQPDYPHPYLVLGDYNKEHYINNGGSINTEDILGDYSPLNLNTNGKNWINKGGTTKFCLRSSREIAEFSSTVVVTYDMIQFYSSREREPQEYRPKLTITYEI